MKIKNIVISILILSTSFVVLYFNHVRYKSFEIQKILNADITNRIQFIDRDIEFVNSINDYYPSLNVFAMPIISMKAQYFLSRDSIDRGIKYLEEGAKRNPYIKFSESVLGEVYLQLGDVQTSDKYIREAFKKIPNNPVHFVMFIKILKRQNKNDSIIYHFNKVKNVLGPKDFQVYNIVLASLYQNPENIEKYNLKDIADEAVEVHKNDMSVKKMSDYIYYTQENVDLAAEKYSDAINLIKEGNFDQGADILTEVIGLHPNIKVYYDNLIIASFYLQEFDKITELYDTYYNQFESIDQDIQYYFAYSFKEANNFNIACEILTGLLNSGYVIDQSVFKECFD
jgi:tetratricopeptide (TPR) repeat protein